MSQIHHKILKKLEKANYTQDIALKSNLKFNRHRFLRYFLSEVKGDDQIKKTRDIFDILKITNEFH